jgi:hypothetical protein
MITAAAAVIGMDAGAARFHHAVANVVQPAQVEFAFRIEAPEPARLRGAQHAVGADHFQRGRIAHDQVVAVLVEFVAVEALVVDERRQPHALDEYLVAQALHFAQLLAGRCQAQCRGAAPGLRFNVISFACFVLSVATKQA